MDAYLINVPSHDVGKLLERAEEVRKVIEGNNRPLDIEDAWIALHFLLSAEEPIPKGEALRRGVSWDDNSMENILMGGTDTPHNGSFGPTRLMDPDEVKRMSALLSSINIDDFAERYDPEALEDIDMPRGDWNSEESRQWLLNSFEMLKRFYFETAEKGDALLLYII
jgi:hypothetical protein